MTDTKTVATAQRAADAALKKAQAVLADLTRQKISASNRQAELAKVRQRLALAGLADGGAQADQRRLADATEETGQIGLQIENLDYAITEAKEHIAAAERSVQAAAVRVKAAAALERVGELRQAGAECAAGLEAFLASFDRVLEIATAIRRLGAGRWPSHEVFELSCRRALQARLRPRHLATEPMIGGVPERGLDATLERWFAELETALQRQLAELEPIEAEAAE